MCACVCIFYILLVAVIVIPSCWGQQQEGHPTVENPFGSCKYRKVDVKWMLNDEGFSITDRFPVVFTKAVSQNVLDNLVNNEAS